jgi:deoxyribonuclease-4
MLIGGHVSSAGGLDRAVGRAEELGCETMQIFNQSPRMWRPTRYTDADFRAFRENKNQSSVESVFIHAVYLINCASEDPEIRSKSIESLTHALVVGDSIGAGGVVVHPGSAKDGDSAKALERIGDALRRALSASDACPLLLENTAGAGGTVGRRVEELAKLIEVSGGDRRIGVCLDSCHLLASGHEIRSPEQLAKVVDECERDLGLDRLRCLHLNDSKTPLGSNRDRHANLGEGELGEDGIRAFLGEPRFERLPVLLEVPGPDGKGPDRKQIEIAKRLRAEVRASGGKRARRTSRRPSRA